MALRIVIVGEGGVGKSCLTLQFINDSFVEEYEPTMEGFFFFFSLCGQLIDFLFLFSQATYRKQFTVDDREVLTDIFDTAGQEDFSAVILLFFFFFFSFFFFFFFFLLMPHSSHKRFEISI